VSIATWDHTMLLATRHKRTHPTLTPASEGWYSIYLPRRDGKLSWPRCRDDTRTDSRTDVLSSPVESTAESRKSSESEFQIVSSIQTRVFSFNWI